MIKIGEVLCANNYNVYKHLNNYKKKKKNEDENVKSFKELTEEKYKKMRDEKNKR
ncbi:hypothetical protein [Clostridium ihumii]|uniref:hypothetical protein n=1 Tax=Clostridium ihumii TaxID=1470356 RepID=UPI000AA9071D|nr:hypothetical protein [Clostridium ihumii]